jgi:iron(III) transport system ATP-binding protein
VPAESALRCRGLRVDYGDVPALRHLDLDVGPGEIVALLGPSGSGKSTLLHAVAGLVAPSAGEIWLAGRRVANATASEPPERRDIGTVFQSFALWPHLDVLDTVAYPMRRAGRSRPRARADAAALLDLLGLGRLAHRRPAELSGGEQQRVGLARALARDAGLYLLDEPTAHLDAHLRAAFLGEVRARQRDSGAAVLYATHDAAEALALADRVALLDGGRLLQVGTPSQVYDEPVSAAAAALTGPVSVLRARVVRAGDALVAIEIGDATATVAGRASGPPHARQILLRPEWATVGGPFEGRIEAAWFRGSHVDYEVRSAAGPALVRETDAPRRAAGETLSWGVRRVWLPAEPAAEDQPSAAVAPG